MLQQKNGHIVNVASILGQVGVNMMSKAVWLTPIMGFPWAEYGEYYYSGLLRIEACSTRSSWCSTGWVAQPVSIVALEVFPDLKERYLWNCMRSHSPNSIRLSVVLPGHIRTSLFSRIKPFNRLASFLLPLQEPSDVARAIVEAIEKEQGGFICIPKPVGIAWLWKGLPSWAGDFLRWVS